MPASGGRDNCGRLMGIETRVAARRVPRAQKVMTVPSRPMIASFSAAGPPVSLL